MSKIQSSTLSTIKRVYCLYRVSIKGQVEKDDIPMQKQYCREFCLRQAGWEIVREFSEKGVSGFKVSAKDRDAIQAIQQDAVEGKFDILLVFMFDRLGRRDDETPFVVEWFVRNGIEVWSAMEGQQRFDNHVDKLLNYIRYWQASGESIKTSLRTKTRMEQLTQEGLYTGGTVPYGYCLEDRGRVNKRNHTVEDLAKNTSEAAIVRLIFQKYVYEGYGAQRLCRYLKEQGICGRSGQNIPTTSINRMLKNPIYIGVLKKGEAKSPVLPELQIVDEDLFARAQEIMHHRTQPHSDTPRSTKSHALLSGKVYCGHCGGKLTLGTYGRKRTRADGTVFRETGFRYRCFYKTRHPGDCDGQSGYSLKALDSLVDQIIHIQFSRIQKSPSQALIAQKWNRDLEVARVKVKQLTAQLLSKQREQQALREETIKVIQGTSVLNAELLNDLLAETEAAIQALEEQASNAQTELENFSSEADIAYQEYCRVMSWADLYDRCSFEGKKMIIAQFVKAIYVRRNYELTITFNVSYEEFQSLSL